MFPPALTPPIFGSALIAAVSGSENNVNNNGENGSPYFAPHERLKEGDISPFVRTDACRSVYITRTQFKNPTPNPNVFTVWNKNPQS